jgi:hypothetical protein
MAEFQRLSTKGKKRGELTDAQAQGITDQPPIQPARVEQQREDPSLLRRTAEFGLKPAAFAAKHIGRFVGIDTSKMTTDEIASATADTPIGYGLGLGTVALEAALGARAAARFIPAVARTGVGQQIATRGTLGRGVKALTGTRTLPHISGKAIQAQGKRAGLTKAGIGQVRRALGKMRVDQVTQRVLQAQGNMLSRYGGLTARRAGGAVLLGWLGADTISQSVSFQASKTENNVIFGQMSKSEALTNIDKLETYNNFGKAAVLTAGAISPAAIPFLIFGWQSTRLSQNQIDKSRQIIENL